MTVRIVTDSTSDIDKEMAQWLGITIVAQNVHFGTLSFEDNVTITPDEFYERLATAQELPTPSKASPGRFREVYEELGRGADGIVSIHISSRISGTCFSARQGSLATSAGCPVEVIDSGQASMGLGLVVLAAVEAVMRGAGQFEVISTALNAANRAQCLCLFETLQYLRKGGRIGRSHALLGSALKIKPMIIVRDGEVHPLGRARTFPSALAMMKETVREFAAIESLAVMHSTTPELAAEVAADLKELLPAGPEPHITRFGPTLGVYSGPGSSGIALMQDGGQPTGSPRKACPEFPHPRPADAQIG